VGPIAALVVLAALSIAIKWVLNDLIPASTARNMGHVTFAIVNAVMLPVCAWCVNRALRYQWRTANLSAISAATHATSSRSQNTSPPQ
jgi:hypothetical protein